MLDYAERKYVMAIRIHLSTLLGEKRWSQADPARATGICPDTIGELYHELAVRIDFEHLDLIYEALGCDITDILKHDGDRPRVKSKSGRPLT